MSGITQHHKSHFTQVRAPPPPCHSVSLLVISLSAHRPGHFLPQLSPCGLFSRASCRHKAVTPVWLPSSLQHGPWQHFNQMQTCALRPLVPGSPGTEAAASHPAPLCRVQCALTGVRLLVCVHSREDTVPAAVAKPYAVSQHAACWAFSCPRAVCMVFISMSTALSTFHEGHPFHTESVTTESVYMVS